VQGPVSTSGSAAARAIVAAAAASAATVAFDTAGRATRDAFFLAQFGAKALPPMVVGGSLAALIIGIVASRVLARTAPVPFLIRALTLSAVALALEWSLTGRFTRAMAIAVYVHFTALSGLFISGFWTVVSERFDPRTARRSVARIAAAGTAGGLFGGLAAERVAVTGSIATMLLILAGLNVAAGVAVHALRPLDEARAPAWSDASGSQRERPQLRTLLAGRYVQLLLAIVILGAIAETCLDFVFMTRASAAFGGAEALLRVFAIFYTAAAVLTMVVQLGLTRRIVELVGLAPAAAALPAGVAVSSAAALVWPGLAGAIAARGTELVLRNSLFRSAYELLCNALPPREKRAAKTFIDVTAVRFGRIVGSVLIQVILVITAIHVLPTLLGITIAVSVIAVALLPLLRRGHVGALESHLMSRAPAAAHQAVLDTGFFPVMATDEMMTTGTFVVPSRMPFEERRAALRSGDATAARRALEAGPLTPQVAPEVVPLLGWDAVSRDAYRALEIDVVTATAALTAALRDPSVAFPIRRRVVLLLGTARTRAARDALVDGLRDPRFEIRYRCGRALTRLVETDPALAPSTDEVLAVVSREVDVSRRVWEDRHLAQLLPDEGPRALLGEVLQERTDRSLEHVFRLLALVLPSEPLLAAFRGLQSEDVHLRGTALDYLEFRVPVEIRRKLWLILEEDGRRTSDHAGPAAAAAELDALVQDQLSIGMRVEELLRKRDGDGG
jgi:ATP:ADP antiporter, AAA family